MSLKNYIFSSINTKGAQDSEKFATIRLKNLQRAGIKLDKMAVKNGANNATSTEPVQSRQQRPSTATVTPPAKPIDQDSKLKRLAKLWSYISVEPLMLCWLLPSCFLFIAVENLALEKVN